MDDEAPLRPKALIDQLITEPLDHLSVDELDARVGLLEAEIVRTRTRRDHAVNHKASAEALFRR